MPLLCSLRLHDLQERVIAREPMPVNAWTETVEDYCARCGRVFGIGQRATIYYGSPPPPIEAR
ncbi:hypothetical protein LCGC14_0313150 [marine sediment metagenome]|uniref:Uncharacterized protein n=1 Tax=marine sediment metagenome TaxID=412755 RepID=A0A0F9WT94_9ZZZZ